MKLEPAHCQFITELLHEKTGIELGDDKGYLVESRLAPLLPDFRLAGFPQLVEELRRGTQPFLLERVLDALTTNESLFFRDQLPFDLLRQQILPELFERNRGRGEIRIWSAACSSGQEPFSIAITALEAFPGLHGFRFEILGTDLCRKVLEQARAGEYSDFEVQRGLTPGQLSAWFQRTAAGWRAKEDLRCLVKFREQNLVRPRVPFEPADLIFCRNVMIYFDLETKQELAGRLADALPTGGCLVLGGAETLMGLSDRFERIVDSGPAVYRKVK